jgi:hypothetical protein
MSKADVVTQRALALHGKDCTYTKIIQGVYDIETGGVTNTTTVHTVRTYKNHIRATQYHYPSLIGKDSALFLFQGSTFPVIPKVQDLILYSGSTYKVHSIEEHWAYGTLALYKIVGVNG